jgi:hypothetical protein
LNGVTNARSFSPALLQQSEYNFNFWIGDNRGFAIVDAYVDTRAFAASGLPDA